MTPKDKALELYKKFRDEFPVLSANVRAKQCALIAVDEILSNNPIKLVGNAGKFIYMDEYWQQVKTEIENL